MSTGRNFDEVLRLLDSIQLTAKHKVATPANWKQGGDVVIVPSVSNDEAKQKYPDGWKSPKPYLRYRETAALRTGARHTERPSAAPRSHSGAVDE
jgi:hypothetical protein